MGIAYIEGTVRAGRRAARVRFMVDTGALYTVLPQRIWRTLRLKPARALEFTLADGSTITRNISECRIELADRSATSPVVLGERDDGPLLGAVTLETLGLMVNPLTRRVIPISTLPLGALRPISGGFDTAAGGPATRGHEAQSPSIFAM
jgi:predicted aspartyl protease